MIEPIVCPLWITNDRRFRSRRYHAWDRPCRFCGRKVIVSDAVKQRLDTDAGAVILCEQCAVIHAGAPEIETSLSKGGTSQDTETCETCAALKEQEESAAMDLARCKDLLEGVAEKEEAYKKWAHVFHARWDHKFKAHNDEPRGR